ncbi:MAG TPA: hypothetical protein VGE13_00135 [Candidatus Saccharimonadales bacterium]
MADKRRVQKGIQRLQQVKTWQLVIVLILCGLLSATFLRLNNIGMIERRTAVKQADERGDEAAIANNLFALQRWSASHMNADSDAFYLEHSYQRDVKKATQSRKGTSNVTGRIVKEADRICKARFGNVYSSAYVLCFAEEQARLIKKYPQMSVSVKLPNPELYRHEFSSPLWSPDFAGWSLLLCGVIILVIIFRLLSLVLLKMLLRRHYTSI